MSRETIGRVSRFLLTHDAEKMMCVLCNYLSLGLAELARAILHQMAAAVLKQNQKEARQA